MSEVKAQITYFCASAKLMLLKLNLNKSFCGTHGLLERDEGLKFLPIKTYFEVAPRSP